jgi:hypothetical protein
MVSSGFGSSRKSVQNEANFVSHCKYDVIAVGLMTCRIRTPFGGINSSSAVIDFGRAGRAHPASCGEMRGVGWNSLPLYLPHDQELLDYYLVW